MLMLNLSCLFWAVNIILGSMLSDYVGPWFIMSLRAFIGSFLFLIILSSKGYLKEIVHLQHKGLIFGMSLTGVVGFQALLYYGLRWTTPVNSSVIGASAPIISLLLAALILSEKLSLHKIGAILISFIGVLFVLSKGRLETFYNLEFNVGDILIFSAIFFWGVYSVMGEVVMKRVSALHVTAASIFISAIVTLPIAYWETTTQITPRIDLFVILSIITIGIFPTVISFLLWNKGVQQIGSSHASLYLNTIPMYTILLTYIFLDGLILPYQVIGMMFIASGSLYLFFANIYEKQSI